jgi:hypothetical protein
MQPQLSDAPAAIAPEPESLIAPPQARFGITTRPVPPETIRIGVTSTGEWYVYGSDAGAKDRKPVEALATPRILDITVASRGTGSRFGLRPYLDVAMAGPVPAIRYVLSLPCRHRPTPHSVRSLLGCLLTLDLSDTGVMLVPTRGTSAAFVNVYLDPEGQQQVRAERIGPDECDLQQAVDTCRGKLGLPPQFALAGAAVQPSLDLTP